jgi:hypothetical protein
MNLTEAFKMAVQKYYEGYSYENTKNIGLKGKEFEYDYDKLDGLQQEMKKKKKRPYVRKTEKPDAMDDFPMEDDDEGFGVNSDMEEMEEEEMF